MAIPEILAIVSLEEAKRYAGVTDTTNDRLIDELVQMASSMINGELGYNVMSQTYREYYSSSDGPNIWLNNIPITSVDLVSIGRDCPITVKYSAGDASRATVEITPTLLRLRTRVSGVITTSELTLADSLTMSALETNIEALTGWTATVVSTFATYMPVELIVRPAISAKDTDISLEIPSEDDMEYELFSEAGRLYSRSNWLYGYDSPGFSSVYGHRGYEQTGLYGTNRNYYYGQNNIVVEYTAGYSRSEVPYGLKSACLELSKFLFDVVQHDSTFNQEKIGDYEYELANMVQPLFSEESQHNIGTKLAPYRRMIVRGM